MTRSTFGTPVSLAFEDHLLTVRAQADRLRDWTIGAIPDGSRRREALAVISQWQEHCDQAIFDKFRSPL